MKEHDIQRILEQQREISPMRDLDPAQINRRLGAIQSAESKRKVPVEHREAIIREYWDNTQMRPLNFTAIIAERYEAEHGVVEKIVMNSHNTLNDKEYQQLRDAYNTKYDRAEFMKQLHAEGRRDNVAIGKKISASKQTLNDQQALEVYERCKPYWKQEGAKAFQQQLAKEYGVSWHKIRYCAMGNHPALADVCNDWQDQRYGVITLTDPNGNSHVFENHSDAVDFIDKMDLGINNVSKWLGEKLKSIEPNTPTVMRRRFWKGWVFHKTR